MKELCYNKIMLRRILRECFTLVELSFSLAFIGILSIVIVLIINNTVVAYRRGMLLGHLNNTGSELVDDMRAALQRSSAKSLVDSCISIYGKGAGCNDDNGYKLALVTRNAEVSLEEGEARSMPIFGAFCTGYYSYIWNSGYFQYEGATFDGKDDGWAKLKYSLGEDGNEIVVGENGSPFRLLKVKDTMRTVCVEAIGRDSYDITGGINNVIDVGVLDDEPEELLSGDSGNTLAIYEMTLAQPAEDTNKKNMFYYVSFILGTVNGGVDVLAKGGTCTTPDDYSGSLSYCAINKFNFAAQVNGG